MEPTRRVFRMDAWRFTMSTLWLVILMAIIIAALLLTHWMSSGESPSPVDLLKWVSLPLLYLLMMGVWMFGASKLFPIDVDSSGIRAYNSFGRYRREAWENIEGAMVRRIVGVPYICISTAGRKDPLTVPVWTADFPEFVATVERYAGESHVLTQVLHTI